METKRTNKIEEVWNLEDLKHFLVGGKGSNIQLTPLYKTEIIPGYDPHDADYIQVFTGIKITYDE